MLRAASTVRGKRISKRTRNSRQTLQLKHGFAALHVVELGSFQLPESFREQRSHVECIGRDSISPLFAAAPEPSKSKIPKQTLSLRRLESICNSIGFEHLQRLACVWKRGVDGTWSRRSSPSFREQS